MTLRRKRNLVPFLCLQAMAVAIICFGSLINFHQYKIWGKPLIPNFVGYKRDIEKYSRTVSFTKLTGGGHYLNNDFQSGDFDLPAAINCNQDGPVSILAFDHSHKNPGSNRVSCCGLRGPPVS